MDRYTRFLDLAGVGARTMQESSAGATRAINNVLGQHKKIVAVVVVFLANNVHQASPPMTKTYDLIAFPQGPNGHRTDCGIQTRYITAASENSDYTLLCREVGHHLLLSSTAELVGAVTYE